MIRKIFACVIISLMMISQASAKLQKFNNISVNVPDGWNVKQQGASLVLKSKNAEASIEISYNRIAGEQLSDVVERIYIEREGVDLEQDDDGDYSFSFKNPSGSENIALITGTNDYYLLVSMTGFENEAIQGDLQTILESIDWDEK